MKKKTVWIVNHYAGNTFLSEGGRHYWFAKELKENGYEPVVFCCNVVHGKNDFFLQGDDLWQEEKTLQGVPYVFIKSTLYSSNGLDRIKNMLVFYRNFCKTAKQYLKKHEKPDVILASSVHPFTVFAGEKIARKLNVPCICEIRDLWPESIFAYYPEKKSKLLAKSLYAGEKRMYKKADAIIMTWPGGKDYINNQGWNDEIPQEKIYSINNGVDLEAFRQNQLSYPFEDEDLNDDSRFNAVYTGSIRKVNNLGILVEAASILKQRGNNRIRILIWGDGDEQEILKENAAERGLDNIIFKGSVEKHFIPSILTKSDCTIMHNTSTILDRYGQSQNKFFEYLAAGKPVLMTYSVGYSICENNHCGVELKIQSPQAIADGLEYMLNLDQDEYKYMCLRAEKTAEEYDFKKHTKKLIDIIESL